MRWALSISLFYCILRWHCFHADSFRVFWLRTKLWRFCWSKVLRLYGVPLKYFNPSWPSQQTTPGNIVFIVEANENMTALQTKLELWAWWVPHWNFANFHSWKTCDKWKPHNIWKSWKITLHDTFQKIWFQQMNIKTFFLLTCKVSVKTTTKWHFLTYKMFWNVKRKRGKNG